MPTSTVTRDLNAIRKSAERMDASKPAVIGTASAGDVVRQGDLYLVCMDDTPAASPAKSRQLAPGTTQGSRHVAEGECVVLTASDARAVQENIQRLARCEVPVELIGPLVRCDGSTTITHPEHGHRILPAGTTWATVYQRAFAEEVRRVQD